MDFEHAESTFKQIRKLIKDQEYVIHLSPEEKLYDLTQENNSIVIFDSLIKMCNTYDWHVRPYRKMIAGRKRKFEDGIERNVSIEKQSRLKLNYYLNVLIDHITRIKTKEGIRTRYNTREITTEVERLFLHLIEEGLSSGYDIIKEHSKWEASKAQ